MRESKMKSAKKFITILIALCAVLCLCCTVAFAARIRNSCSITTQPTNTGTIQGTTATVSVTATGGSGATLTYQWQESANMGSTWANVSEATSASYTIPNTKTVGTYYYRCVVTSILSGTNDVSATSNPAKVSIVEPGYFTTLHTTGGTIYYDAGPENGVTYVFLDASNNVVNYTYSGTPGPTTALKDVTSYCVIGTPTRDRFYAYYANTVAKNWGDSTLVSNANSWGVCPESGTYDNTYSPTIGLGSFNTSIMLSHISQVTGTNTIWHYVKELNDANTNGHNDWFIPSSGELVALQKSVLNPTLFNNNQVWTSNHYSPSAVAWQYEDANTETFAPDRTDRSAVQCLVIRAIGVETPIPDDGTAAAKFDINADGIDDMIVRWADLKNSSMGALLGYNANAITDTSIGDNAFKGCVKLTYFKIPDTVTSIGSHAFQNCFSLQHLELPATIDCNVFMDGSISTQPINYVQTMIEDGFSPKKISVTPRNGWTLVGEGSEYAAKQFSMKVGNTVVPTSVSEINFTTGNSPIENGTIPVSVGLSYMKNKGEGATSEIADVSMYLQYTGVVLTPVNEFPSLNSDYLIQNGSSQSPTWLNYDASKLTLGGATSGTNAGTYTATFTPKTGYCWPDGTTVAKNATWIIYDTPINFTVTASNRAAVGYTGYKKEILVIPKYFVGDGNNGTVAGELYKVTSIGANAFEDCTGASPFDDVPAGLSGVTIPDSVTSIGAYAFSRVYSLENVTIPNSVTSIGAYAFSYCAITSLTIPNGMTSIGAYAFSQMYSLENVTIPNSVTSIGDHAFEDCRLTSITIPNSVTSIGAYAFSDCFSLSSITIPDSVTSIGDYAFYGPISLDSLTIGNGITNLPEHMFSKGLSLTSLTIGDGVTDIKILTQAINFARESNYFKLIKIGNGITSIPDNLCGGKNFSVDTLIIGNSVTSIGDYAFSDCYLRSTTIPDSVTSIGDYAFSDNLLTSITIPNSVTSIGDHAFSNNSVLTSITISNGVTSIGDHAFEDCRLTSITIPNSVTSIGAYAFYEERMLRNITATFMNTTGWKAGSISLSSSDLANTSTAYQYLASTYAPETWTRS